MRCYLSSSVTLADVPFPFRRKPTGSIAEPVDQISDQSAASRKNQKKSHTPSISTQDQEYRKGAYKRQRGIPTPKRAQTRRPVEPPPANRREAYKQLRSKERAERAERRRGMVEGDERYMLSRDKGPERALVRDIVDSRLTVGTWFLAGGFVVLIGASVPVMEIRFASQLLWITLAVSTTIDSFLLSRKIKKLVTQRFPSTQEKLSSLYFYGILRGITFRRMRMPRARIKLGQEF